LCPVAFSFSLPGTYFLLLSLPSQHWDNSVISFGCHRCKLSFALCFGHVPGLQLLLAAGHFRLLSPLRQFQEADFSVQLLNVRAGDDGALVIGTGKLVHQLRKQHGAATADAFERVRHFALLLLNVQRLVNHGCAAC
jgi:hypothetical protein